MFFGNYTQICSKYTILNSSICIPLAGIFLSFDAPVQASMFVWQSHVKSFLKKIVDVQYYTAKKIVMIFGQIKKKINLSNNFEFWQIMHLISSKYDPTWSVECSLYQAHSVTFDNWQLRYSASGTSAFSIWEWFLRRWVWYLSNTSLFGTVCMLGLKYLSSNYFYRRFCSEAFLVARKIRSSLNGTESARVTKPPTLTLYRWWCLTVCKLSKL